MKTIRKNEKLMAEIGRIAEVAGYLWTKGWAERNGGNISVNLTDLMMSKKHFPHWDRLFLYKKR